MGSVSLCRKQGALLVALLVGCSSSIVHAESLPEAWNIAASNNLRYDYYGVGGDAASGPYASEGSKTTSEFTVDLSRQVSTRELWKGQVSGALTNSAYRSAHRGIVPERLQITWEKGDFAVPYRLEAGDLFSFYSYRTLQRSLKGLQLEIQPGSGGGRRQSLIFTSGAQQSSWRDFEPGDSYFNGLSYLLDDQDLGRYILNLVAHTRQEGDAGEPKQTQYVYGVAAENRASLFGQELDLEGELSRFQGDHDGPAGQDRSDLGIFAQLGGKGRSPLTYRLRYEEYGQDYRPAGAVVGQDRRSLEGHLGWRFGQGYQLQGRLQRYRDQLESDNSTGTSLLGFNLRGGLGFLDAYLQGVENEDETVSRATRSANLTLNLPRRAGWNPRLAVSYQDVDDRAADLADIATFQTTLSADHAVSLKQFSGVLGPGIGVKKVDYGDGDALELYPTLALNLRRADHSLNYQLSYTSQRRGNGGIDVSSATQTLDYRVTCARSAFGVEIAMGRRSPDPGESTGHFRMGAFWTYALDYGAASRGADAARAASDMPVVSVSDGPVDLAELAPGVSMEEISRRLSRVAIYNPVETPGLSVYEVRLLDEIDQRQRLALKHSGGRLQKASLIIDPAAAGDSGELLRLYVRVRDILLDAYGSPACLYESDAALDQLFDWEDAIPVRLTEWRTADGILRLGIPRRRDGQLRLEIQHAADFPPPADLLWSVAEVR